jgi:hypothetical protein
MNFTSKSLYVLLIVMNLLSNQVQAKNSYDQKNNSSSEIVDFFAVDSFGRTPLFNYLIQQEAAIAIIRKDIPFIDGCCKVISEHSTGGRFEYDTSWGLFYNCKAQLNKELPRWLEYRALIHKTIDQLSFMIHQGASLHVKDNAGKTILAYCQTKDIYNYLRSAGVNFEIVPSVYFMEYEIKLLAAFVLFFAIAFPIKYIYENQR